MATKNAAVLCADATYFPFAYLVATQLAEDPRANYDTFILTVDGPHLARVPADVPFTILTPDMTSGLPTQDEFWKSVSVPAAGCGRLYAPSILKDYDRILYLDSDVRLAGSVNPIFDLDLKGKTIAAFGGVIRHAIPKKQIHWEAKLARIGLDPADPYFSSGILLIDGNRWREDRITDVALACIARLGSHLYEIDQDCLNVVFRNAWLPISPRWNFEPTAGDGLIRQLLGPVVFHNLQKPWIFGRGDAGEVRALRDMLARSPFHDLPIRQPSYRDVRKLLGRHLKQALVAATPFLASSRRKLAARAQAMDKASELRSIENRIRDGEWEDYNQGISRMPRLVDRKALAPAAMAVA